MEGSWLRGDCLSYRSSPASLYFEEGPWGGSVLYLPPGCLPASVFSTLEVEVIQWRTCCVPGRGQSQVKSG